MENILIREEGFDDIEDISLVNTLAFEQPNEAELVNLLRETESLLSLVAVTDNLIIGHVMFSRISIQDNQLVFKAVALAPMAVHPDHQRLGVGTLLVSEGLKRLKEMGEGLVVVLGHKEYYPRFGFQSAMDYRILAPFDVGSEYWMVYELQPGELNKVTGTVVYPDAFDTVS